MRNVFRRALKESACAAFEDFPEIERASFHSVEGSHLLGDLHLLFVLLTIVDRKGDDFVRPVLFNCEAQTDRAVESAAE